MKFKIIDLNFFTPHVISVFLIENKEPILIETGPDSVFSNLIGALNDKGYQQKDIKHVFVTHIHLDHSGSAWHFAESGATIYVHPKGAEHLEDPSKLIRSASLIYKDKMDLLWGKIKSINKESICVLQDGNVKKVDRLEILPLDTPGHAKHHYAYLVEDIIFSGDVGGVRVLDGPTLPPVPPPDINVELWIESIKKIRSTKAKTICPTHFGSFHNVDEHLDKLENNLRAYSEWAYNMYKRHENSNTMLSEFKKFVNSLFENRNDKISQAYEMADPLEMNLAGIMRYIEKFRIRR